MRKKIQSKIDDIKTKPLEERNRYAKIAALTVTGIFVLIWLLLITLRGNDEVRTLFDTAGLETLIENVTDEASELGETLDQQKDNITQARDQLRQQEQTDELALFPNEVLEQTDEMSTTDESMETKEETVEEPTNTTQL